MSELGRAASPARFGLTEPRSEEMLRGLGLWADRRPAEGSEPLLSALSRCPDPDLALRGLERLQAAADWDALSAALHKDEVVRGRLLAVLGSSTALSDFLVANPDRWRSLTDEVDVSLELADGDVLRTEYRAKLLLVAANDLAHVVEPSLPFVPYDTVAAQLSDLAVAALRASLKLAEERVNGADRCRLAVIAMGKCGANELNYVSDVDVVFVGEGDLGVATRLASTMMQIAGQSCFEVDAALRPEGKAGALVRTLDGHASYYKKWARTWEFQALLKARPVVGDAELGQAYLDVVRPYVWTAAERENFVEDVQAMRRRVEDHVPTGLADRELKLGRGGLRDVEFAVQLLQLVHGRSEEDLRIQPTTAALTALSAGGYVGREDAATLISSYRYLRTVEHRLQLLRLRRTHLLPSDDQQLRWLARSMGYKPDHRGGTVEVLRAELALHTREVRRLHEKLFYRPLLS